VNPEIEEKLTVAQMLYKTKLSWYAVYCWMHYAYSFDTVECWHTLWPL